MTVTHDLDTRTFRDACGRFLTGVTIVTAADAEARPIGMTANAFTSVSLDPPLVLVCVGKSAASHATMVQTDNFAVHVLSDDQEDLSTTFARSAAQGEDKFADLDWDEDEHGVPSLPGSLARMSCRVWDRLDAGDHLVVIGQVLALEVEDAPRPPLGFFGGSYARLAP